ETAAGRAAAGLTLAVLVASGALLAGPARRKGAAAAAALALALGAYLAGRAPDGRAPAGAALRARVLSGSYPRLSPFNVVPEIDQVRLGAMLTPGLFARIDPGKSERILALTMPLYRAMEADADYRAIGSAMPFAFADLAGAGFPEHYWAYRPPAPGRVPVLLFLHGAGGNFKSYLRFWQELADREQVAVVCPSHGFGGWGRPDGLALVEHVLADLAADPGLDLSRVVLAGLSNGGIGAT